MLISDVTGSQLHPGTVMRIFPCLLCLLLHGATATKANPTAATGQHQQHAKSLFTSDRSFVDRPVVSDWSTSDREGYDSSNSERITSSSNERATFSDRSHSDRSITGNSAQSRQMPRESVKTNPNKSRQIRRPIPATAEGSSATAAAERSAATAAADGPAATAAAEGAPATAAREGSPTTAAGGESSIAVPPDCGVPHDVKVRKLSDGWSCYSHASIVKLPSLPQQNVSGNCSSFMLYDVVLVIVANK